jgi:DNA topoisomerase-1
LTALALREIKGFDSAAHAKRNVRAAIARVAARLGNTPTICRKCYVHPQILSTYLEGRLVLETTSAGEGALRDELTELLPEEAAVLEMLRIRPHQTLSGSTAPPLRRAPARHRARQVAALTTLA